MTGYSVPRSTHGQVGPSRRAITAISTASIGAASRVSKPAATGQSPNVSSGVTNPANCEANGSPSRPIRLIEAASGFAMEPCPPLRIFGSPCVNIVSPYAIRRAGYEAGARRP